MASTSIPWHAAAPEVMHRQRQGATFNTASVGGNRGVGNQSGCAPSKHGVVGLTRTSAVEYGYLGSSIKAIAPGAIVTPMIEASFKQVDPQTGRKSPGNSCRSIRCNASASPTSLPPSSPTCCQAKQR